jgi:hypothetical protein
MDDMEGGRAGQNTLTFGPATSTLDSYDGTHVTSPGRQGIPALVPSWSQADE